MRTATATVCLAQPLAVSENKSWLGTAIGKAGITRGRLVPVLDTVRPPDFGKCLLEGI